MGHPLIDRLSHELGWPVLNSETDLAAFTGAPGTHCLFVPGDPRRNLESADVAVILPELRMTFQAAFDCAVVGDAVESTLRETSGVLKTPSLIFYRSGLCLGGIPKVRDWDDYMTRIARILNISATAEA